jgi:cytochrome c biogenesis protein CcmG/thiol:disulfide interchange protein DsbE
MTLGTDMDLDDAAPEGAAPPAPERVRDRHTARWVGVCVLVIAAGLVAVLATRPSAQTTEAKSPLVGRIAPPITGATLDGSTYSLARAPGHYVVVNFFASWCIPCQEEGPELAAFQFQHLQSGTASVVSVVFDDTSDAARAYQQKLGATWPTLADANQSIALNYGVHEDPTSFVIAPDGRVVASILGGVTAKGLNAIVARATADGYGT